jgi:putative photosynthetic complex assembly protein 2
MDSPWIATLFVLFVWWFSTGAILWAVKRADRMGESAHLVTTIRGLPLIILGWWGLVQTSGSDSIAATYGAFLSALAIWGWIELAFLCGVITGPNMRVCPPGVPPWERFTRAWGTIAYSELVLVLNLVIIMAVCWEAINPFGMWTFIILFLARISAKLNVYFGVPNINFEFLPHPMLHLASHFRVGPMNWFFPIGISSLTLALGFWLERAHSQPDGSATLVGFTLLAALTALALVEHWVMVLPIPDAKLWRWMVSKPDTGPMDPTKNSLILREETR